MNELPFSRVHGYKLIEAGVLISVSLKAPGSSKGIRLIDGDSLDRYLEKLAADQRVERKTETVVSEVAL